MQWDEHDDQVIHCRLCPRLVSWREEVAVTKRKAYLAHDYWGKPVPGFGDRQAKIMVVGLAPGAHGSNRTGRMFTGDASGDFLYPALHKAGFASQPLAQDRNDTLFLKDLYITAVCRCAPPDNKPLPAEEKNCQPYLLREIELLQDLVGFVALGKIAFDALCQIFIERGWMNKPPHFSHGGLFEADGSPWLLASYHPSRQNTQTGKLTVNMFDEIWKTARARL
ncbi:MAG: uracil-DNA glycosylase [Anaerolineaceae bacterium]|nr:uracil-DNA glycosylase [Anaerolineaceae bacterium]